MPKYFTIDGTRVTGSVEKTVADGQCCSPFFECPISRIRSYFLDVTPPSDT